MDFPPRLLLASALLCVYVALGMRSNFQSLLHQRRTGRALTPVNPVTGIVFMALIALSAALHVSGLRWASVLLFGLLVVVAYVGVLRHLLNSNPASYASPSSRKRAIAINLFGVLAMALVLLT